MCKQAHPLLSTSSLAAFLSAQPGATVRVPLSHLTPSPGLHLTSSPSPSPISPVPRTITVFVFILVEEAEALQDMLHSDAKTGGPAAGKTLSLLGVRRESELLPLPGCPPCAATAQPSLP